MQIPFHKPDITDEEINGVVDTLRSGWVTTGPKVKEFEARFAEVVGARHAIAVNSCTAAMHLALEAIGRSSRLPNSVTQNIHFVSGRFKVIILKQPEKNSSIIQTKQTR